MSYRAGSNRARNTVLTPEVYDLFARSEAYHDAHLIKPDPVLDAALENAKKQGIEVEVAAAPSQAKFLHLVLLSMRAKRVLEVGTLWGYGAIWMARALPEDGEVVALELDPVSAKVTEENAAAAGVGKKLRVIVGPALTSMQAMEPDPSAPYDLVFIDADKRNDVNYFVQAKRLLRPGGVIVVDNVGRRGRLPDEDCDEPSVIGTRELLKYIKNDPEVEATTIHTVGEKGFDGILFAYVK
ncbi:O-methyltransferase family 3 protein [Mycena capillaripes]|nr:O-methyltransferase family 3 protein [Mycena capillaripes]